MPTSLISTGVQFPDNSIQTTAATGGGDYAMNAYASPTTWTKPAGLKAVKVTVVGAGGAGGSQPSVIGEAGGGGGGGAAILYLDAPAIPGPITVTAGAGINSFGPLCSATAGTAATSNTAPVNTGKLGGAGGTGSGGTVNLTGQSGGTAYRIGTSPNTAITGAGGDSLLGMGGAGLITNQNGNGNPGIAYGGGGSGATRFSAGSFSGGSGAPGIVIVEEFY